MKTGQQSGRRWWHCYLILLVSAGALLLIAASRAQEKIGYVLDVKGMWSLDNNPSQRLSRAAALPAEGVIRLRASSGVGANYIVIANLSGEVIKKRECYGPENCQEVVLPRSVGRSISFLSRVYTRIMDRVFSQPDRYRAAISRGAGGEMQEAVVMLTAGKVNLGSAFTKMGRGKYLLRLESPGGEKQETVRPLEFEWNPAVEPSLVELNGIKEGLYRLSLLDARDGQSLGGGMDAWILVCEPETYEKVSSDFREVSKQTAAWESKVSRATIRSFLRAYLDELAERKQSGGA